MWYFDEIRGHYRFSEKNKLMLSQTNRVVIHITPRSSKHGNLFADFIFELLPRYSGNVRYLVTSSLNCYFIHNKLLVKL